MATDPAIGVPYFQVDATRVKRDVERIELRLGRVSRPIAPLVQGFAKTLRASIDAEFATRGRNPFPWAVNRPNTIVKKGHGRILESNAPYGLRQRIRVVSVSSGPNSHTISVFSPRVGVFHQWGTAGPYIIRAKNVPYLLFQVTERFDVFSRRRAKALSQRRRGLRVTIPSRPGPVWVARTSVMHPGVPQRKFVVVRPGLLREGWYRPASAYLVGGVT